MKFFNRSALRSATHPLEYSPHMDEYLAEAEVQRERQVPHPAHLMVR